MISGAMLRVAPYAPMPCWSRNSLEPSHKLPGLPTLLAVFGRHPQLKQPIRKQDPRAWLHFLGQRLECGGDARPVLRADRGHEVGSRL